jgi:cadmium resistance protein CadD (predicted permease)
MPGLILTGILTFAATNIDDIVLLVVFFKATTPGKAPCF